MTKKGFRAIVRAFRVLGFCLFCSSCCHHTYNMDDLPDEMVAAILSHLPPEYRPILCGVCMRWAGIAADGTILRETDVMYRLASVGNLRALQWLHTEKGFPLDK